MNTPLWRRALRHALSVIFRLDADEKKYLGESIGEVKAGAYHVCMLLTWAIMRIVLLVLLPVSIPLLYFLARHNIYHTDRQNLYQED